MTAGVPVSGVRQTIKANVTTLGTYNISTSTVNGVTFSGTGTFTGTGEQDIVITASGKPIEVGEFSFTINTTPTYTFNRTAIKNPSSNGTANISTFEFNDQNGRMIVGVPVSGITQTLTVNVTSAGTYSISTTTVRGVTFRGSGTFAVTGEQDLVLTASGTPTEVVSYLNNIYTSNTTPNLPFGRGIFEPSSNGYAVVTSYSLSSSSGTMYAGIPVSDVTQTFTANVSKAGTYEITTNTVNGVTFAGSGTFASTGDQNITLTASGTPTVISASDEFTLNTNPSVSFIRTTPHASTNGTAVVTAYSSSSSSGTMTAGVPVSDVTQTFTANVTTAGTYSITITNVNGITFEGSGTFVDIGDQNITLTASGTPISDGTNTFILNTNPDGTFTRTTLVNPSSNGTANVTSYELVSSAGTMADGVPVSNVTQTIIANVATLGSYNISATSNGVTFSRSGSFSNLGARTLILTATGTPIAVSESDNFISNTIPSFTFTRTTNSASTNGLAIISGHTIGISTGTMKQGVAVTGVSQTISVNVTTLGTYNISAVKNGVTFAASGTFTNFGNQNIVLIASGTPGAEAVSTNPLSIFTTNTTPSMTFGKTTSRKN
jgi:hypothetical protein